MGEARRQCNRSPARAVTMLVIGTALASVLSACGDASEARRYGPLSDFCDDLDYSEARAMLPEEDGFFVDAVKEMNERRTEQGIGTLECGAFDPWFGGEAYGSFAFQISNQSPDQAGAYFYIADDRESWEDMESIYPFGKTANPGTLVDPENDQLTPPEVEDLELDGWERASYVRYFQGNSSTMMWDPDGTGMILYFSLQDANLTVDFSLRLGDDGSGVVPETEPYVEMMIGIADQIADELRTEETAPPKSPSATS